MLLDFSIAMMITQFEVHDYFKQQLPVLIHRRIPAKPIPEEHLTAKAAISAFRDYTQAMVFKGDIGKTRQCLQIVEQLYLKGDWVVRMLIEDVYVALFASLLQIIKTRGVDWDRVIPQGLLVIVNDQQTGFTDN